MKKNLFSIITAVAVVGLPTTATAQTSASTHSGSVTATCSLVVTDGTLADQEDLSSVIETPNALSTRGLISTVCNSPLSTLTVSLDTPIHPPQQNVTQSFRLSNGTGAYSGIIVPNNPSGFTSINYQKINLVNTFASAVSTIAVRARIAVPPTQNLAAGSYTAKVVATVTP